MKRLCGVVMLGLVLAGCGGEEDQPAGIQIPPNSEFVGTWVGSWAASTGRPSGTLAVLFDIDAQGGLVATVPNGPCLSGLSFTPQAVRLWVQQNEVRLSFETITKVSVSDPGDTVSHVVDEVTIFSGTLTGRTIAGTHQTFLDFKLLDNGSSCDPGVWNATH